MLSKIHNSADQLRVVLLVEPSAGLWQQGPLVIKSTVQMKVSFLVGILAKIKLCQCVSCTLNSDLGCGHCQGICSTDELCRYVAFVLRSEADGVRQRTWFNMAVHSANAKRCLGPRALASNNRNSMYSLLTGEPQLYSLSVIQSCEVG